MTRNQIEYWTLQETRANNKRNWEETKTHNRNTEKETNRSNLERERQGLLNLAETSQHNRNTESIQDRSVKETIRSNLARERETTRSNRANEELGRERNLLQRSAQEETARSNRAREKLTSEQNANTRYGLETSRMDTYNRNEYNQGMLNLSNRRYFQDERQNAESNRLRQYEADIKQQQADVSRGGLAETMRSNQVREDIDLMRALEGQRHNKVSETQGWVSTANQLLKNASGWASVVRSIR